MKKQKLSNLIEKKLKNEILPDEEILLNRFLDSFQLEQSAKNGLSNENEFRIKEKIYQDILEKINHRRILNIQYLFKSNYALKVAASIAVMLTTALTIFYLVMPTGVEQEIMTWSEKSTLRGEQSFITYYDGTKIYLNSESNLKYPANADMEKREVYLEGEAYFEVVSNPSKPFVVHTGNISTTALGTKFNVNSFNDDNLITVSLLEGKVKVADESIVNLKNSILLKPKQQLVFNTQSTESVVNNFNPEEIIGWKDNILIFENEPLNKILKVLERSYGVEFELENKSYSSVRITAEFNKASIWTVAKVLTSLTQLNNRIDKEPNDSIKKIIFFK